MENNWTNFGAIPPKSYFTNYKKVQNNRFFGAGGHVFQSIKPIINPIRLLNKGLIPAKFQVSSSNRLGEKLLTRSNVIRGGIKRKKKYSEIGVKQSGSDARASESQLRIKPSQIYC